MSPGRYGQDEGCIVANRSQDKKARKDNDVVAVNQLPSAPPDLGEEDPTYVTGEYNDEDTVATAEDKMQASAPTIHIPVVSADSQEELDLAGGDSDEASMDEPTRAIPAVTTDMADAAASGKKSDAPGNAPASNKAGADKTDAGKAGTDNARTETASTKTASTEKASTAPKVPSPGEVAAMAKSAREEKAKQAAEEAAASSVGGADKPATAESLTDALNDGYERHGSQGPGSNDSLMPKVIAGAVAVGFVAMLLGIRKKRQRRRLAHEQAALEN